MMDKLTDQEKSVLLAKAMGWLIEKGLKVFGQLDWIIPPEGDMINTIYAPENMALAWRVLNWWHSNWWPHAIGQPHANWYAFDNWWKGIVGWGFEPQELQRAMLDKILSLAIEAGLVELEEEKE